MRWTALFALILSLLVFDTPVRAVDGTDLPGRDYTSFPAPTPGSCRRSCGGDERCQAYTWVKPGFQGPNALCYLKSSEPPIVKSPCCDSAPRRFISKRDMVPEDKTDRPGFDYKNFDTQGTRTDWLDCQAACEQDSTCRSWAYGRANMQGRTKGHCWLKNRVAAPMVNPGTVSGVKYRPASVRFD